MSLGDEGTDCASAFVVLLDREMGDDVELLRFRTGESRAVTEGACTAALLGTVIAISGDCGVGALLSKEPEATFTKEGSSDSAVGSTSHGMLTGAIASPLLTGIDDANADTAAADDDDAGDGGDAQTTSAFSAAAAAATDGDNAVDTASKVNTVTAGAVDTSADDGDDADTTAGDSTDGDDNRLFNLAFALVILAMALSESEVVADRPPSAMPLSSSRMRSARDSSPFTSACRTLSVTRMELPMPSS